MRVELTLQTMVQGRKTGSVLWLHLSVLSAFSVTEVS